MTASPATQPFSASDPVLTALQRSADLLDSDASAVPTAGFQQRARLAVLQAAGIPRPVAPGQQLLAKLGSAFDRRRLIGVGVGAALLGMVAVPAMAAPSPLGRTVRGAVGAAIGDVPALFAGAPSAAPAQAINTERDERTTATSSALSAATDADAPAQGLGATISTIARSTNDQGEAHGAAVSSAAHSLRLSPANLAAQSARGVTAGAAATAPADADSHGDAVSSAAHTAPPAGETHGRQVSSVARLHTTETATLAATSEQDADSHGDAVSTVARSAAPAGENHGQQVSAVAHGVSTESDAPPSVTTSLPPTGHGDKAGNAGATPSNRPEGSGKSHGR